MNRLRDIERVLKAQASIARKLKGLYAEYRFARDCGENTARLEQKIAGAEQAIERLEALAREVARRVA